MATAVQGLDLVYAVEELARLTSLAERARKILREALERVNLAEAIAAEFEKAEFGFLARADGERFATEEQIVELERLASGYEKEMDYVERVPIERASEAARDAFAALEDMHLHAREQILERLNGSGPSDVEQKLEQISATVRGLTRQLRGESESEGDDG
jgi:hypothetical protein